MASCFSSSPNFIYDVFPSFRGEDVRKIFLSHFLGELDRKYIKVFKDNKIERGQSLAPELKLAIESSRIAVVLFSKNYACSSWCLNELLEIVKCKEKFGQIVIPIFYCLDPSHVRNQTGEFGKIFERTCRNKTQKVKNLWKTALTDVANILGYHSVTWDNEAKMIETIANNVLQKLCLTSSKYSEDFVGIENHIEKMILLLDFKFKEARMVGIWGPEGIGKTTIARVLFNRLYSHFEGSVFVDRAFVSKSMGIFSRANRYDYNMKLHLQNKFLSEILGIKDIRIRQLGAVEARLKNRKVLIFIDDLETVVLDTLAGHANWFGSGSRIIVITKDKHSLVARGVDHIYKVPFPSDDLALKMLCQAAFPKNYPPDGFTNLAFESALHAGNLPLGLNVLGSYLRGRNKEEWNNMLLMFREGQYGKIEEILQFNYSGLNKKNNEAIIDYIACLFNGEKLDDVKSLLADTDLDLDNGIQKLVDQSFIHEKSITVGCTQSNEPGDREFQVDSKDISKVLEDVNGTGKIIGISLNTDEINEVCISESASERILNVNISEREPEKEFLAEHFHYLPPKIRLLNWKKFPIRRLPSRFRLEYLVSIEMQRSKLEKLWEGVQSLPMLENMDLWGSENLKEIPNLSMAINLKRLNLGFCSSLVELPSSVQYLNKLMMLDMSFCKKLETLPANINLQALDSLNLTGCSRLRCFPCISTNISFLNLSRSGIEEVPWWIENFTKLKIISMQECQQLNYVSLNISKLKHLEKVDFSNCSELNEVSLSERVSSLSNEYLRRVELDFINCLNLDQEALLQQQSVFKRMILSGDEVPSYFTHHTTKTSLTNIPLLQTSLSQPFFIFKACAVVDSESTSIGKFSFLIEVHCRFIDILGNHFGSAHWQQYFPAASLGSHLVVFNCCLPLNEDNAYLAKRNYDHVDIQFHLMDDCSRFKLKGCGIRLSEDCTPSLENDKESENEGQVWRASNEETDGSRKRIKRM